MDLDDLRELAEFMVEYDLAELAVEDNEHGRSVHMRRGVDVAPIAVAAPAAAVAQEQASDASSDEGGSDTELIRAPMDGTIYRSPRPGDEFFVEVGASVADGDVLCIVEAMKLMNHIEAEFRCEIVDILVDNAASVEYGEPLFRVRRS